MSTLTTKNINDTINTITINSPNLFGSKDIYNNYYISANNELYSNNVLGV